MLRTGTDPGPVSRLVPPGAHGKLFSGGRLGKAGVWAGSLPPLSRAPPGTGLACADWGLRVRLRPHQGHEVPI